MGVIIIPFFVFFLFHYVQLVEVAIATTPHLCTRRDSLLLLQFKQSFKIDEDDDEVASSDCYGRQQQPPYPKTSSWNRSMDCCIWDGVTCDEVSGEVIGLDLSCSRLQGVINSNSSLFQLSHLLTLNLAYNDFSSSLIPTEFSQLQSLTHLNLSRSLFSGPLPSQFSHMFNLISLDLSSNDGEITLQPRIFELLLQNLTQLRQVSLENVDISHVLPRNLSASLEVLNLRGTSLFGQSPIEMFQLPKLKMLQLSDNFNLAANLLKVKWNSSSSLSYLDLSDTGLSGELPESIGNLKSLYHLDLSHCHLSGFIPESLGNLTQMQFLSLGDNNLTGPVPLPSSLANLEQLIVLDLSINNLGGQLAGFFSNFKSLTQLSLNNNRFNGCFPSSIINLTNLETIDLSNNALNGPLPPNIRGFPYLVSLHLQYNLFNGTIPSWIYSLPSLTHLSMRSNLLTGQVFEFQHQSLEEIDLCVNQLNGPIPESISKLVNLAKLDLSYNSFSGDVDVSLFSNLQQLYFLDLSFNSLSLINDHPVNSTWPPSLVLLYLSSCGVKDLDILRGAGNLLGLSLSGNNLHGRIFTAEQKSYTWAQNLYYLNLSRNFLTDIYQLPFPSLVILDLRSNLLRGPLLVPSITTQYFLASANNLSGEIPPWICNLTSLVLLDLSNSSLSGALPQCLGNAMSGKLLVLDLHMNNFHGIIPSNFSVGSKLRRLNLRDNRLEGTVPRSLSNCRELEVIDIGNNNLNGTFPWWLKSLPNLQVLSLTTNHLHGPLTISRTGGLSIFPALKILDLSRNQFTGIVPATFFTQLRGMKIVNRIMKKLTLKELYVHHQDSGLVITKGLEIDVASVLSVFTTIDLSSNRFQGVIPGVIGNLISLQGLNLSHNKFGGQIPPTLRNLTFLESLDLSSNQLEGEIPAQLAALTFLSVLNLSQNHLVDRIPRGPQFDTFDNTSYLGNEGLCGFPLSKACGDNNDIDQLVPPKRIFTTEDEDFMDGFTWRSVLIGYGCGMVIGATMGCLIFITGKPKAFCKFVEEEGRRLIKKKWPKEVKWLLK